MARIANSGHVEAQVLALEAHAERAGAAQRRAAGVYGPRRHRKQMLATAAGIAVALAVFILLIV